ncbi:hypothetical protein DFP83_101284 [Idiomarina fontislapidosi]|uniref:Type II secretion system protein n=1 Tax=Idiomarina fontislapidosi TaxID=263723 RepID=A0A432YBP1_9GAMM|nr:hypothetical protein [Idiomarina fontislapidosi]PYE35397.1 hypothetical protein DFP83_101284 [Idiomarina fontislapidosi]RUO58282.1 hypothetical protein CWE25_01435 [Idiomarina fontislapidosi]
MTRCNRGFAVAVVLLTLVSLAMPAGSLSLTLQRQHRLLNALTAEYVHMIKAAWQLQSHRLQRVPSATEFSSYLRHSEVPWSVELSAGNGGIYAIIQPVTTLQRRYLADHVEGQWFEDSWRIALSANP